MKSDEGGGQRPSRSIGQRVRDFRRSDRELREKDARKERASAKKAEAAERKNDREEEASAKEFCREQANRPRPGKKAARRSEAELRKLGGTKDVIPIGESRRQTRIIFGGEGETRLIFTPYRGAWMVALEGTPSLEDERRELNKSRRKLWNADKEKPDIAAQAVDALLSCFESFKGLRSNEQQADEVKFAIIATLQALKRDVKNKSRKLQVAFEFLDDPQWPTQIGVELHWPRHEDPPLGP
jgi:hypothetical protein